MVDLIDLGSYDFAQMFHLKRYANNIICNERNKAFSLMKDFWIPKYDQNKKTQTVSVTVKLLCLVGGRLQTACLHFWQLR